MREAPRDSYPREADVRRWLSWLHRPDLLAESPLVDVLRAQGRLHESAAGVELGRAAAAELLAIIERFRPADGANWQEQVPYRVLHSCYVRALKHLQVASELNISPRQLTRERVRAVRLIQAELGPRRSVASPPAADPPAAPPAARGSGRPPAGRETTYRFTPIPAILDFLPRPAVMEELARSLAGHRFVHVHGPRGIGKTSLVAELALGRKAETAVLWFRFRASVNDDIASLLFELAEHLRSRGRPGPAEGFAAGADHGRHEALLGREIIRDLADLPLLVVLDDYHVVEHDAAIAGFVDDAASRLSDLRVIAISRHSSPRCGLATPVEISPMSQLETRKLIARAGMRTSPTMAASIHRWTAGIPQLIVLAATWMRAADEAEIARGLAGFSELDEVQEYLVGSIAELIESADRAVLDAASVFRQHFSDEAVAAVAGLTVGVVRDTSRRAVRAHLATRSRGGDVAFFHASVREYFYQQLDHGRRAALHARAADWYDRHGLPEEADYHRQASRSSS